MRSGEETEYQIHQRIARVTRGDVGGYSCHLITSYDSLNSRPAALTVRSATRIINQPQHQTVGEGATVQFRLGGVKIKNMEREINSYFSCEPLIDTSANRMMRIVWYRNSGKLEEGDRVEFAQSGELLRKLIMDLIICLRSIYNTNT